VIAAEQIEYLILWAARQARRERRKYRIRAAMGNTGWYYHALPEEEWRRWA
jgi:hypothetical protein